MRGASNELESTAPDDIFLLIMKVFADSERSACGHVASARQHERVVDDASTVDRITNVTTRERLVELVPGNRDREHFSFVRRAQNAQWRTEAKAAKTQTYNRGVLYLTR